MITPLKHLGRKFKEHEKNINKHGHVWNTCDNYKYYYNTNCFSNMKNLNINIFCHRFWGVKSASTVDDANNLHHLLHHILHPDHHHHLLANLQLKEMKKFDMIKDSQRSNNGFCIASAQKPTYILRDRKWCSSLGNSSIYHI